jgi:hypothetical protein
MWSSSIPPVGEWGYPQARQGRGTGKAVRQRSVRGRVIVEALEGRALVSFLAPVNYTTDSKPRSAVVGDFNGDK